MYAGVEMRERQPRQETAGHRQKATRVEEQVDDLHVVIESGSPFSRQIVHRTGPNSAGGRQYETANYRIYIDQEQGSNLDVTLKLNGSETKYNKPYLSGYQSAKTQKGRIEEPTSRSQVQLHKTSPDYEYLINYVSRTPKSPAENPQPSTRDNDIYMRKQPSMPDTRHIIKIVDGHYVEPSRQTTYEHMYSFGRDRQEKSFGSITHQVREGKIVKNGGESSSSLRHSEQNGPSTVDEIKITHQVANYFSKNKNSTAPRQTVQQSNSSKKQEIKADSQIYNRKPAHYDNQMYISQPANMQSPSGFTSKHFQEFLHTPKAKEAQTQPNTSNNRETESASRSPNVYEYRSSDDQIEEKHSPVFRIEGSERSGREQRASQKLELVQAAEEEDGLRKPPTPTIEKKIQKQMLNQSNLNKINSPNNPKTEDADKVSGNPKIASYLNNTISLMNRRKGNNLSRSKDSHSPIVVPIQKLPKTAFKIGTPGSHKHSVPLNRTVRHHTEQPEDASDSFVVNKKKYLDRLRRQERSRSRLENSRTLSRHSRPSLSPECSSVTNRLHASRINKQPCPKYLQYQQVMERKKMKEALGEYTFIRRYLSDQEIYEIMAGFQESGVPEKKWPLRLVDIVYDKLRGIRPY